MYRKCPVCGHERQAADSAPSGVCPRCGLVFAKWMRRRFAAARAEPAGHDCDGPTWRDWLSEHLLRVPDQVDDFSFYGRLAVYALFLLWGLRLIWLEMDSNAIGASFLHNVDLVFHEAGHVLFRPFGWLMTVLGGSLMQLLVPAVVVGVFVLREQNPFSASIGLWWLGQSLMDLAPYINDARDLKLVLLGGGTGAERPGMHDWENILRYLGLLDQDHRIAWLADVLGEALMLAALAWGGWLMWEMYRRKAR